MISVKTDPDDPFIKIHLPDPNQGPSTEILEYYDEYMLDDKDPSLELKMGPIRGFSRWLNKQGEPEWRECMILDYRRDSKKFLIKWICTGAVKEVNLFFKKIIN